MVFRPALILLNIALCVLLVHNTSAFQTDDWVKAVVSVPLLHYFYFQSFRNHEFLLSHGQTVDLVLTQLKC